MPVLHIDSRYRANSGDSRTDFSFTLNNPPRFKRAKLLDVTIPLTMYVFNSTNNVLTFNEGASDLTATITSGNYTPTTLITEIETRMNAASSQDYNCYYDERTGLFSIGALDSYPGYTPFSAVAFVLKFSKSNSPWKELGFANADTSSGVYHSGTSCMDISPPSSLLLSIDGLGFEPIINSSTGGGSAHFIVHLEGNSYSISKFYNNIYKCVSSTTSNGTIRVRLTHMDGTPVTLYSDWSLNLYLSNSDICQC